MNIRRLVTLPAPSPGFIGAGHTAVHVIDPRDFSDSDPFILLADDRINIPRGRPAGAAHPHAGFEIVTFVVAGEGRDRDEGLLREGDAAWMSAGSGVVHNEDFEPLGPMRILQLWVTSPSAARWAAPRFGVLRREELPVRRERGIEARIYMGESGDLRAPSHTNLPLTLVDVRVASDEVFEQELLASYNGFLYVLEGDLVAGGTAPQRLAVGQVGWLEPAGGAGSPPLRATGGPQGARFLLYAGERQRVPIVTHGPFVGETRSDLVRVSQAFARGELPRVSELGR